MAELIAAIRGGARKVRARGLVGASRGHALWQLTRELKVPLVCIVPTEDTAEALEKDLRFFAPEATGAAIVRLPGDEVLPYEGLTPDPGVAMARIAGLFHLHLGDARIVIASVRGLARRVLPREALDQRSLQLATGATQDRDELANKLTAAGYAKVPLVEDPGTFAVRGGVFDVWSPLEEGPVRIEFFGDDIESLRRFDPQTQRSIADLTEISLCPAREIVLDDAGRKAAIATVRAAADAVETPTRQLRELIDELQTRSQDDALFAAGLSAILPGFFPGGLKPVTDYLPAGALWALDAALELDRQLMAHIVPHLPEQPVTLWNPSTHAHLVVGQVSAGFLDEGERIAVYSDEDVFGPRAQPRKAPKRPKTFGEDAADFKDLKEGDLVVHVEHGIARYDGLTRLDVRGFAADFILLQFAGKDRLYMPVGRLRQIQKYVGGDPSKTKLDSLKSQTFQKRKAKVKEELLQKAA